MDNPEILTTLGTQGMGRRLQKTEGTIKNGQSRDTDNIGYTIHMMKKNTAKQKQENTRQKTNRRFSVILSRLFHTICAY
jgi:hypothetical protein